MTHYVLIGLGVLIAVLTVVAALGLLPSLRIVPDDTHFDFTRFRRISFPISALLSIVAITLFFTHGLNFGIDFKGGTLLEVQAKSGTADIAAMRATLERPRPRRSPAAAIRRPRRRADPRCRAARRRRRAAGGGAEGPRRARRFRRISPRRGGGTARLRRAAGLRHARPDARDRRDPDLSLVPLRMAVRARRHDRQRARHRADHRLHVDQPGRFRPDQHRGAADHSRLFAQRHRRHLRPHPRDAAALQEDADAAAAQRIRSTRRCRARSSPTSP